ncbi:hypothetical protein FXO37_09553 [Capsicum annuum]|nr:hypothetical protein FXO37_09553 [Capsicum annuum]
MKFRAAHVHTCALITSRILLSSGAAESPIEYPSSIGERKIMLAFSLERTITSTVVWEQTGGFLVIKVSRCLKVTSGSNRYFDHSIDSFLPVRACCHAGKSRDVGQLYLLLDFSDQFFAAITLIHPNSISGMEIGLAVGGAFLSSALNVLFDRLAPHGSSNLSLSDDFFLNIKEKLEDTIETLEDLQKKIGLLGLQKYLDSGKKIETRTPATSVVESDVFGRQNEIERLIDL